LHLKEHGISGRLQKCIIVTSPDYITEDGPTELYASRRWIKNDTEGPEEGLMF